jgi:predicted DNA-binding transcriptional regulator YafY
MHVAVKRAPRSLGERGGILGFGRAAEVLEPEALRLSVIDFARQIVEFYAK